MITIIMHVVVIVIYSVFCKDKCIFLCLHEQKKKKSPVECIEKTVSSPEE